MRDRWNSAPCLHARCSVVAHANEHRHGEVPSRFRACASRKAASGRGIARMQIEARATARAETSAQLHVSSVCRIAEDMFPNSSSAGVQQHRLIRVSTQELRLDKQRTLMQTLMQREPWRRRSAACVPHLAVGRRVQRIRIPQMCRRLQPAVRPTAPAALRRESAAGPCPCGSTVRLPQPELPAFKRT